MINYARNAKNKCVSGIIVHRKSANNCIAQGAQTLGFAHCY